MQAFLNNIAKDLFSRYNESISDLCIVFPNRRAGLYFKKYLAELNQKPIWAPTTTTINELVQQIAGLTIADNIKLLFELYLVYKKCKKSEESFDDFYFWGEMLLNDFDDIDKYQVKTCDLFDNIESLKDIDDHFDYLSDEQINAIKQFWKSFDVQRKSSHQENFISLWSVLLNIYEQFNANLKKQKLAYEGMVYRSVADKLQTNENLDLPYSKYIFVGFNALNTCEQLLFSYLQDNDLADFYWDYDESYVNNEYHEAGFFLRKNIRNFTQPNDFVNQNIFKSLSENKNINIISVPSDVGQAKAISEILNDEDFEYSESPNKTAIVLSDEDLLVPVLHSIPDTVEKLNITMGYPVSNTPIYSLLEHVIELQKNAKRTKSGITFYHKNVIAILNHQYINTQFEQEAKNLLSFIKNKNRIVIQEKELANCDFFKTIFTKINSYTDLSDYFLTILHHIYNSLKYDDNKNTIHTNALEKEYIYHIYLSINRIKDVLSEQNIDIRIDTYIRLVRKIIRNLRVPFTGEPLLGVQLMGILETRLLDFENLIITSLNEGVLPKTEATLSFIPYNLRRGFGLPTIEHQDAIFGYYFYRLLQRAKNITLLYNSSTNGMQTGEMSRFIYQLKYESNYNISEKSLRYDINIAQPKDLKVDKTKSVINKFDKFLSSKGGQKYLSPSALTTYLRCKLQFYFKYLAELREHDDITEEIDAPLFGNILHESIDCLYKPFVGRNLLPEDFNLLRKDKEKVRFAIDHAFKKEYFKSDEINYSGKNIIVRDIIEKYILQILKIDEKTAPLKIISLENTYQIEIPISQNGSFEMVKLGGKIDRVDEVENNIRIIDYKTGGDKLEFTDIESLFSENVKNQSSVVFQTLLYAKFYSDLKKPSQNLIPGVYSVRKIFDKNFDYRILCKKEKSYLTNYSLVVDEYLDNLNHLIQEIFNPDTLFEQTQDIRTCEYCDFKRLCHK